MTLKQDRLSYAQKSQIVNDWASEFPDMFKNRQWMALHKRVGPILISIGVYAKGGWGSWEYKPVYVIDNLASPGDESWATNGGLTSFVRYEPIYRLHWNYGQFSPPIYNKEKYPNWEDYLKKVENNKKHHDQYIARNLYHYDGYKVAAEKIRQNAWIPLNQELNLEDIWRGVNNYCSQPENRVWSGEICIPVYVAAWAGEEAKTQEYLEWIIKRKEWFMLSRDEDWVNTLRTRIAQVDQLRDNVHKALASYKLEKIPYQNIIGAKYQE